LWVSRFYLSIRLRVVEKILRLCPAARPDPGTTPQTPWNAGLFRTMISETGV